MRLADIKIGETYLTLVSGALVRVVAVQRVEPTGFSKTARFRVRRVDNGKTLDKTRAASALRPLPAQDPIAYMRAKAAEETKDLHDDRCATRSWHPCNCPSAAFNPRTNPEAAK